MWSPPDETNNAEAPGLPETSTSVLPTRCQACLYHREPGIHTSKRCAVRAVGCAEMQAIRGADMKDQGTAFSPFKRGFPGHQGRRKTNTEGRRPGNGGADETGEARVEQIGRMGY